ncbi:hypothetical protein D2E26_0827 [Bifidobacterium dolichotidis]|uniref:Pr6Pr family membrane protein n=1 Tax=Bifidobacterium dolichotidis TaxID=2306976 RepID=A0A430FPL7_9BIFI|nr:Pr6Pr family membrane protein [Bifidobacterium dolichotidis]RSX54773.1 hypothetical protein D2E26_0827 [Bifidobacterium dolichotidis]
MSTSRTAQLIVQSAYVSLGIIATLGSLGLYKASFDATFYTYFTNLSNYLCLIVMFVELVRTARSKSDGYVTFSPKFKFICVVAILLTGLVYNFILAGAPDRDPMSNYEVTSILFHTVLPILFTLDWLLFFRHGAVTWATPLISAVFPLAYVAFVFIRAALFPSAQNLFPYFFLDPSQQGVNGILTWIGVLLVGFIVLGYVLMAIDHSIAKHAVKARVLATY